MHQKSPNWDTLSYVGEANMDLNAIISRRIRSKREQHDVTQDALAGAIGFKDRQTIAKIESHERRVTAEELVAFANYFKVDLGYFTDPFRLDGEARFSWRRQLDAPVEKVLEFEAKAAGWISLFRVLARAQGEEPRPLRSKAPLDRRSTFQDACKVGEATASQIGFADVTSQRLKDVLERSGILVLYVDAIPEVSGAACQLTSLHAMDVILINRSESSFRRKFDLAHEFFHLLTWDAMPPQHLESINPRGNEAKVERLAENFAAGLLMPMEALRPYLESKPVTEINSWLNATATALGVSASSLRYRLQNCGLLSSAERAKIDESKIRNNGLERSSLGQPPALFSRRFLEVIGKGIAAGQVSVRKACNLLQLEPEHLKKTFAEHGLESPMG